MPWLDETVIFILNRVGIKGTKKAYNELRHNRNLIFICLVRQTVVVCNAAVFYTAKSLDKTFRMHLTRDYVQETAAIHPVTHEKLMLFACRS